MALCAVFQYELGQQQESNRLFDQITDIAYSTGDSETLRVVTRIRQLLPAEKGARGNVAPFPAGIMSEVDRDSALAAARELAFA
jgi:hypothetical protein